MNKLPPIPTNSPPGSSFWNDWYEKLRTMVNNSSLAVLWTSLNFTGSNITDIATRLHNSLQSLQGGVVNEYYHLSAAEQARIGNLNLGYGYFYDTTTQTAAAINTAYAITLNTTSLARDISIGTPTSRIVVAKTGVYNFHFSLEAEKLSAAAAHVFIWPRVNGTDVTNSGTKFSLAGSSADGVPSWNFLLSLTANDYFELMWSVEDTGIKLEYYAATAVVPAIPSIIMSVTQVSI